jgi:hypothetical protein
VEGHKQNCVSLRIPNVTYIWIWQVNYAKLLVLRIFFRSWQTLGDATNCIARATPDSSSQVVIIIIFMQKQKNSLLSQVTPHAYICTHLSTAHPSIPEEVKVYKNNFVFPQGS